MTPAEADVQGRALHALVEAGGRLTGIARWKHALWCAGGVWTHAATAEGVRRAPPLVRHSLAGFAAACRALALAEGDDIARRWGPAVAADTCPAWVAVQGAGRPQVVVIDIADAMWRGLSTIGRPLRPTMLAAELLGRLGLRPGEGAGR